MNQWFIAGLLLGLASLAASAQVAPYPNDQNQTPQVSAPAAPPTFSGDQQQTIQDRQEQQNTDADTPQKDQQSPQQTDRNNQYPQANQGDQYPQQQPSDREYNRNHRYHQHPQADEDRPYQQQNSPDYDRNRQQANRNRNRQYDQGQYNQQEQAQPRSDRDYDRDRNNNSISGNAAQQNEDRYRDHHSEYQSQLENAFQQQPNLAGVQATFTNSTIELTGTVPTGKDQRQARNIARNYANGRKVVDHIRVTGRGH